MDYDTESEAEILQPGLYEQVINYALIQELSVIADACKSFVPQEKAEAFEGLAQYLSEVVQKGLDYVLDNGGPLRTDQDGQLNCRPH